MKKILLILLLIISLIGCSNKSTPIPIPPNPIDTTVTKPPIKPKPIKTTREKLLDTLQNQLYVRETSPNRGPMIDKYLKTVNSSPGQPWCGGFVGANLTWLNIANPNSAWSPDYAKKEDIIWNNKSKNFVELKTGDVVTYYYSNLGRVGHTGFYIEEDKEGYFITIEGNTNGAGSREGDGVYKKKRDPAKVHAITRYIK